MNENETSTFATGITMDEGTPPSDADRTAQPGSPGLASATTDLPCDPQQEPTAGAQHQQDIAIIGAQLIDAAWEHGLSDDYDEFVDSVNPRLSVRLPQRERDHALAVPGDLAVSTMPAPSTSSEATRARHQQDIVTIGAQLIETANAYGWCQAYDDVIEALNERLHVQLSPRKYEYTVEVRVTVVLSTITAGSSDRARELAGNLVCNLERQVAALDGVAHTRWDDEDDYDVDLRRFAPGRFYPAMPARRTHRHRRHPEGHESRRMPV